LARSTRVNSPAVGHTIGGKFRIDAKLGEGGMGAVYKAWDIVLNRAVALKVIRPELARDPSFIARFTREGRAAACVRHPNVIEVFDLQPGTGSADALAYMAFEFLDGARELSELIKGRELGPPQAAWILDQVLSALELAHASGVVHRDLKPQNIMIESGPDLRAKILDFGIAKMKAADENASVNQITMAGQVMGTAYYMSPEQAMGKEIDGRTDLYACGVMLYLMLSGRLPFKSKSILELIDMHIKAPVPPLGHPAIAGFESIVQRAMAKDPADRFQSAEEFRQALSAVPEASWTDTPRPPSTSGSGIVAIPATGLGQKQPTSGRLGSALQHSAVNTPTETYPTPERGSGVGSGVGSGPVYMNTPAESESGSGSGSGPVSYNAGQTGEFFSQLIGKSIGKYVIESKLGTGGMGAVFKARNKLLDRAVAVKVVHPHLANDAAIRRRFIREANAALEFTHPNAIATRDCDLTDDGLLYMIQDFCPGVSLRNILQDLGPLGVPRSLKLTRQILLALVEAHGKGIVHRDLKPENMLVESNDHLKVCDFGIAKILDAGADAGESLTAVGQVLGTPHYMAPEQAEGAEVTARTDLYSVGCVLYELLTGTKPFDAKTLRQIVFMHLCKAADPMAERAPNAGIPANVERLVLHAMAKNPAERIPSAEAFVQAIDELGYDTGGSTRYSKPNLDSDFQTTLAPSGVGPAPSPFKGLVILAVIALLAVGASFLGMSYVLKPEDPVVKISAAEQAELDRKAAEAAKLELDTLNAAAEQAKRDREKAEEAAKKSKLEEDAKRAADLKREEEEAVKKAAEARRKQEAAAAKLAADTKAAEEDRRRAEREQAARVQREADAEEKNRLATEALEKRERDVAAKEREVADARKRAAEDERQRLEREAKQAEADRRAEREAELRREDEAERARKAEEKRKRLDAARKKQERIDQERRDREKALAKNPLRHLYPDGVLVMQRIPKRSGRRISSLRVMKGPVTRGLYTKWLATIADPKKKRPRQRILTNATRRPAGKKGKPRPTDALPTIPPLFAGEMADWLDLRVPSPDEAVAIARFLESEMFFWDDAGQAHGWGSGRPRLVSQGVMGMEPVLYLVKR
jgi:serine/threonine protein kinase